MARRSRRRKSVRTFTRSGHTGLYPPAAAPTVGEDSSRDPRKVNMTSEAQEGTPAAADGFEEEEAAATYGYPTTFPRRATPVVRQEELLCIEGGSGGYVLPADDLERAVARCDYHSPKTAAGRNMLPCATASCLPVAAGGPGGGGGGGRTYGGRYQLAVGGQGGGGRGGRAYGVRHVAAGGQGGGVGRDSTPLPTDPDIDLQPKLDKRVENKRKHSNEPTENKEANRPLGSWCDLKFNSDIYVTGLPDDVTTREIIDVSSKCGTIKEDPETRKSRVKIFTDKGTCRKMCDALVTFLKEPPVPLAIEILDGTLFRPGGMTLMSASVDTSQLKGGYNDKKVMIPTVVNMLSCAESRNDENLPEPVVVDEECVMFDPFDHKKKYKGSEKVTAQMQGAGVKPDTETFSYLISNHDSAEKVSKVFPDNMISPKYLSEVKSVLVGALASNGNVSDGLDIFDEIKQSDGCLEPKAAVTLLVLDLDNQSMLPDAVELPELLGGSSTCGNKDNTQIFVKLCGRTISLHKDLSKLDIKMLTESACIKAGVQSRDFYSMFAGIILEPNKVLSDYKILKDSTIHVNARLRGGCSGDKTWDKVISDIDGDRFHLVTLPHSLTNPEPLAKKGPVKYLSPNLQFRCRMILICLCKKHFRDICFGGSFCSANILFDEDGGVRFHGVKQLKYKKTLAFADYKMVHTIFNEAFKDEDGKYAMHSYHLISFLSSPPPEVDPQSEELIAFITNHYSLLSDIQRVGISYILDLLLERLSDDQRVVFEALMADTNWMGILELVPAMELTLLFHKWYDKAGKVHVPYTRGGISLLHFSDNFFKHNTKHKLKELEAAFSLAMDGSRFIPHLMFDVLISFKQSYKNAKIPIPVKVEQFVEQVINMFGKTTNGCERAEID